MYVYIEMCIYVLNTHNGCFNGHSSVLTTSDVSQSKLRNVDTKLTYKLKFMSYKSSEHKFEPYLRYSKLAGRDPKNITVR